MNEHPNIFPTLRYTDADAAIEWLKRVFGLEEQAVHRGDDGVVHHAELRLGTGMIMLGQHREDGWFGSKEPDAEASRQGIYVVLEDVDAHYARAKREGADIFREPADQDYGSHDYSARDLEGNRWSFGTYDPYAA
jgi:uncharacterized glyoxalase superfamily protein PhnB